MQKRTVNLVLALVTGRVWGNKGKFHIDLWDCQPWMGIIADTFVPSMGINEKMLVDLTPAQYPHQRKPEDSQ